MKEKTILAENLKRLRKEHGLTQQQLANLLKQKRSTYAYYENGVTPSPNTVLKLAKIFDVSTHELVYGPIKEDDEPLKDNTDDLFTPSFSTPSSVPPKVSYPSLTLDEKNLVLYMRLLPMSAKNKILGEVIDLVSKNED